MTGGVKLKLEVTLFENSVVVVHDDGIAKLLIDMETYNDKLKEDIANRAKMMYMRVLEEYQTRNEV